MNKRESKDFGRLWTLWCSVLTRRCGFTSQKKKKTQDVVLKMFRAHAKEKKIRVENGLSMQSNGIFVLESEGQIPLF